MLVNRGAEKPRAAEARPDLRDIALQYTSVHIFHTMSSGFSPAGGKEFVRAAQVLAWQPFAVWRYFEKNVFSIDCQAEEPAYVGP